MASAESNMMVIVNSAAVAIRSGLDYNAITVLLFVVKAMEP